MIARRAPSRQEWLAGLLAQRAARIHRVALVAAVAMTAFAVAGVGSAVTLVVTPEPATTTVVGAPACGEAIAAARDAFDKDESADRSRARAIAVTDDVLPANQEGRAADLVAAVEQSNEHLADQIEAETRRDAARELFEAKAAQCTPERPE